MTGRERIDAALTGQPVDRLPTMPILHSGLPPIFGVPMGNFFTSAETMADVIVRGLRTFGYDGVQLSLGVTGEVEALGATVDQPLDAAPILRQHLLPDLTDLRALEALRDRASHHAPAQGGRMPLYCEAVARTREATGDEAFVLAMLRGPLLTASQLCGVESLLLAMITAPEAVVQVLEFTTDVALQLGKWLLHSGAHGLILGEATCSPNFISPKHYRRLVHSQHRALIQGLRRAGWQHVGLHICGNVAPIMDDIISTGATFMDVDYQVPAARAKCLTDNRIALRGNLDPSSVFRFGSPDDVRRETTALIENLTGAATDGPNSWILSSGCDIPPGTPAENISAFVAAATASRVQLN
ncbi:MAG: uroporphyrinogen decarboxylase family protein [Anaerolineae bacterium]|nr:uroporphyrinogen decarboxylase family protein [Anaerolineae bacterium]